MLVTYFSAKHHTAKAAAQIARLLNADIFEIQAAVPYSADDLFYQNPTCRANTEQRSSTIRVDFLRLPDVQPHSVILLGYPIWWDSAPKIIWNAVEQLDLKSKTIIPFCTSGGSSIDNSRRELAKLNPAAQWKNGFRVNMGSDDGAIRNLLQKFLPER